ncbi:MAG: hypothetical protein IPF92_17935 [Myxococcales bacterium]|nr:hypothetical protein [Myxococcales bacterium]MBL0196134.1 hypothetical protein [Myxococcales bacterium]
MTTSSTALPAGSPPASSSVSATGFDGLAWNGASATTSANKVHGLAKAAVLREIDTALTK